jgi:hypothetical protein
MYVGLKKPIYISIISLHNMSTRRHYTENIHDKIPHLLKYVSFIENEFFERYKLKTAKLDNLLHPLGT